MNEGVIGFLAGVLLVIASIAFADARARLERARSAAVARDRIEREFR